MDKKKNEELEAAHDYREQQQQRYGEIGTKKFIAATREKFDDAIAHIQTMFPEITREDVTTIINTHSPGQTKWDEPIGHSNTEHLRLLIEQSAARIGFKLHGGVSIGVLHGSGSEAMQQHVMMTNASVVLVTSNLLLMTHRLAKLLALSLPIKLFGEEQFTPVYDLKQIEINMLNNEILKSAWREFFLDHASDPKSPSAGSPVFVFGKEKQTLWDDLSESMELFIVGHEYGHHIAKHRLGEEAQALGEDWVARHKKEFEADIYGILLSAEAGQCNERPNWFALTSVGAVIVLTVLELNRQGIKILETGQVEELNTRSSHPDLEERIKATRAATHHFLGDEKFNVAIEMQNAFLGLIELAWIDAKSFLIERHHTGARPHRSGPQEWLP
jgi:hypothetical protein